MIYQSKQLEEQAVLQTAAKMCAAARTAPKAHGRDTIHAFVLTGGEKEVLAEVMEKLGDELMGEKMPTWYGRDANNVRSANAVVLIGVKKEHRNVPYCGYCGFQNCISCENAGAKCAFAYIDLGVAVSSAVSTAAMDQIDCRIMFSIGNATVHLPFVEKNVIWLGIPLSISGKNIFFDRNIFHD
ncbi:ferredoxin domain-containing protein [Anaerotignum sp.]|uniref:ferredoxin domain-containing protein n=1 Tax=Anaerotignum sp. TaxID=2039241 RepID=UPI0027154D97|nr:DUF2148 domain-containing protein [Anaerotignum sp.]